MGRLKKICCMIAVFVLVVSLMPVSASAATPRLNKTSKTLKVGQTYTLKVLNNKKAVKWSSSNKSVATVSSKGKVSAKSTGKATITAKVAKKTYKCKITVKKAISMDNIVYTTEEWNGMLIMKITNHNDYPVYLETTAVFFDTSHSPVSSDSEESRCMEPGEFTTVCFEEPYDPDEEKALFETYELHSKIYEASPSKSYIKDIDTSDVTFSPEKIVVRAKNNSDSFINLCKLCIFMYDESGKLIRYQEEYVDDMNPDETAYVSFDYPWEWDEENQTGKNIKPVSYRIYVLCAANVED